MATVKKSTAKARLAALHAVGLAKDIPGNRKLSEAETRKIQSTFTKAKDVVLAPEGEFKAVKLKTLNRYDAAALKSTGYPIIEGKVFIPVQGYQSAQLKIGKTKQGAPSLEIIRKRKDQGREKIETDIYITSSKKMTNEDRLKSEWDALDLKSGEKAAVKTDGRSAWSKSYVTNYDFGRDLIFNTVKGSDHFRHMSDMRYKENFLDHVHFVKVTYSENGKTKLQDRDFGIASQTEKNRVAKQKSRKGKKLGVKKSRRPKKR